MQLADDQHAMKIIHVEGKEHLVSALRKGKGSLPSERTLAILSWFGTCLGLAGHGFTQSFESQATNGSKGSLQRFSLISTNQ